MLTLDSKTPGNGTCLVEPLGGFSNGGCHFIVVVHFICDLHFAVVLHFISRLLYHATGTQSWLLRPVKASTGSDLYPDYFWLSFLFHLPHIRQFWVGIFHPQAFFTFMLLSNIFGTTCIYQGLPRSWQFFLEVCRTLYWSLKHSPGPSVCLIHSNPQSFIHFKFVFIHVNITKALLVV